jgi:NTE family protein
VAGSGDRPRIGLALGGGSARGLAHVGVLSVLLHEGIPIDCVAGTSAGSVVGAALCAGLDVQQMLDLARQIRWGRIASLTLSRDGLVSFDKLERWLVELLGDLQFSDLHIPFAAVATDLESGEPVVLTSGRVAPAVRASSSMPGIVTPLRLDGQRLVDGSVAANVPVAAVRQLGADYIIGVDIGVPQRHRYLGPLGIAIHSIELLFQHSGGGPCAADCLIVPDLRDYGYVRFPKVDEIVARGAEAAQAQLPALRERVTGHRDRPL